MGTSYYWRRNICDSCERYDEMHVGKSSAGWTFLFRGYPDEQIYTVLAWRELFAGGGGQLFDEYGRKVEDPVGWLDEIDLRGVTPKQIEWEDSHYISHRDSYWREPGGFRFTTQEFS